MWCVLYGVMRADPLSLCGMETSCPVDLIRPQSGGEAAEPDT